MKQRSLKEKFLKYKITDGRNNYDLIFYIIDNKIKHISGNVVNKFFNLINMNDLEQSISIEYENNVELGVLKFLNDNLKKPLYKIKKMKQRLD